jgi:hypothetical protein
MVTHGHEDLYWFGARYALNPTPVVVLLLYSYARYKGCCSYLRSRWDGIRWNEMMPIAPLYIGREGRVTIRAIGLTDWFPSLVQGDLPDRIGF